MYYRLSDTCQVPALSEIYTKYLGNKVNGTFVEIGANDGEFVSNTSGLADIGWTGFYVEPVPEVAALCSSRHYANKSIKVDTLAIGSTDGTLTIHIASSNWDSTADPEMLAFMPYLFSGKTVDAPMLTLNNYLTQNNLTPGFDLLVVDTEGGEWDVMQASNIDYWLPKMIIIELHELPDGWYSHLPGVTSSRNNVHEYLSKSYTPVFTDKINTIFVLKELL